jgi:hypothetical protein
MEKELSDYEKWRRFKRQAQLIANLVDDAFAEENFRRSSGDIVCPGCGLKYFDHPTVSNKLVLTCQGEFLHL